MLFHVHRWWSPIQETEWLVENLQNTLIGVEQTQRVSAKLCNTNFSRSMSVLHWSQTKTQVCLSPDLNTNFFLNNG